MNPLLRLLQASACLSAVPVASASAYFPPSEVDGGWRTLVVPNAEPTAAQKAAVRQTGGIDWDQLAEAWKYTTSFGAPTRPNSVLVIRHGWICAEWSNMTKLSGIASASKSITGLTAAKLFDLNDAGAFKKRVGIDDFAWKYLPASWGETEPARRKIQLRHLLTMTAGLTPYDGPYAADYEEKIFAQTVEAPPGTVWAYASHTVDMVSYIVDDVAGWTMADFFNQEIGSPIGAATIVFPPIGGKVGGHSGGSGGPGGGIRFSARDLARVGYLLLHEGKWEHAGTPRQIISARRVKEFTQNADWLKQTTFRQPNFASEKDANLNYGHLFWNNSRQTRLGRAVPRDAYYMSGWGKQCCVVIPSLDMVVVRLGPMKELNTHPEYYEELFARIMAAVTDEK